MSAGGRYDIDRPYAVHRRTAAGAVQAQLMRLLTLSSNGVFVGRPIVNRFRARTAIVLQCEKFSLSAATAEPRSRLTAHSPACTMDYLFQAALLALSFSQWP
jgi:hypothetical protein